MYVRHCVKLVNLADKLGLGDLLGEVYVKRLNPNFSTSLSLHAHIALRVFSATHYYYCQSRHLTKSRAKILTIVIVTNHKDRAGISV